MRSTRASWGAALTVGRDHAGDGGHDGVNAKVLDEEGQIVVLSTGLVPNVARLIVVESDAVARAKQLGEVVLQLNVVVAVMRNEVLEGRVGDRGQVLDGLQDDHGLAVGEHGRDGERDDAGHEDGEDLGQLGLLGHASPGGHDIDLHVSGAHSLCTCAMSGGEGKPKRRRGGSGGEHAMQAGTRTAHRAFQRVPKSSGTLGCTPRNLHYESRSRGIGMRYRAIHVTPFEMGG